MATDPRIILGINPPPDPSEQLNNALTLKANVLKLRQEQQAQQQQNQLRAILTQPDAIGPDGQVSGNALRQIFRVDPMTGQKLAAGNVEAQLKRAQTDYQTSRARQLKLKTGSDAADRALVTYNEALKEGTPEAARAKAQAVWDEERNKLITSGDYSDEEIDQGIPAEFDPASFTGRVMSIKDWLAAQERARHDTVEEKELGLRTRAEATAERREAREERTAGEKGWTVQHDPVTGQDYRYNPSTAQATTLTGEPYTPQAATKERSGQPRSAKAMAAQLYLDKNPNATWEDMARVNARMDEIARTQVAFGPGKTGDAIRYLNNAIGHSEVVKDLAKDLDSGDVQTVNRAKNRLATEFGNPAVTNFNAAKRILADEVTKAIIAGGGTMTERQEADKDINAANSWEQISGVIDNAWMPLLAGQMRGLQLQYESSFGGKDFGAKLARATKRALGFHDEALPTDLPSPSGHAEGSRARDPKTGKVVAVIHNGQWVSP